MWGRMYDVIVQQLTATATHPLVQIAGTARPLNHLQHSALVRFLLLSATTEVGPVERPE